MRRLTAGLAGLAMLAALAACAGPARRGPAPAAGTAAANSTTAAARAAQVKQRAAQLSGRQLNLAVYYLRTYKGRRYLAPEWHPVPYTRAVAAAALGELLDGQPLCRGSRRPFPAGARLRGVRVEAGTATVDLSGSALPARSGALVKGGRLLVKGEASVYEGTVGLRLRDDRGQVMAQGHATAARGAPGRGPFAGSLSFTAPATSHAWTLEAFEVSPEDGAIDYALEVPVWVGR